MDIKKEIYFKMANAIRALSMDAVEKANSGHPGMPMGMADVATILFSEFLKFDSSHPNWSDRDRFILSAGHGSMLLYSLLYLTGYSDITIEDIKNFRSLGAKAAGHPEYGHFAGIETTTGPLGQGLANAVGMALAERIFANKFPSITDHYTYVIVGDGCLMEGISQEAISFAGHLKLNKLIVLFDDNKISIDGPTDLSTSEDHIARFKACNWNAETIDGHDYEEIRNALSRAKQSSLPSLIACGTKIAYGAPTKEGKETSHGSPLGASEISGARKNLNWPYEAFEIPTEILDDWRKTNIAGERSYQEWCKKFDLLDQNIKDEFERINNSILPKRLDVEIESIKKDFTEKKANIASRKSSGLVLEKLVKIIPELIGGSADLTGSNDTKTTDLFAINKDNFKGRYIHYGIREHAMAAIMNGLSLHKGIIPYGGTFLVFADYCRPAIRLSALMGIKVIYVMTHDSIGLGEDGPTHQPIEHLASLRAIPNIYTFRPADSVEVAECWEIALKSKSTPSILALSRQNIPLIRKEHIKENLSLKGGYIISEHKNVLKVTIMATGSEVQIAIEVQKTLEEKSIGVRVISMVSTELFDQQSDDYRKSILGNNSLKVAIEAGSEFGWHKYIGENGIFIGMHGFGASAKAEDLYKYFGITAEQTILKILDRLR